MAAENRETRVYFVRSGAQASVFGGMSEAGILDQWLKDFDAKQADFDARQAEFFNKLGIQVVVDNEAEEVLAPGQ